MLCSHDIAFMAVPGIPELSVGAASPSRAAPAKVSGGKPMTSAAKPKRPCVECSKPTVRFHLILASTTLPDMSEIGGEIRVGLQDACHQGIQVEAKGYRKTEILRRKKSVFQHCRPNAAISSFRRFRR